MLALADACAGTVLAVTHAPLPVPLLVSACFIYLNIIFGVAFGTAIHCPFSSLNCDPLTSQWGIVVLWCMGRLYAWFGRRRVVFKYISQTIQEYSL